MVIFLISALRAIIEMLGLCFIAQAFLYIVAGERRGNNPIYQMFTVITHPPYRYIRKILPVHTGTVVAAIICFAIIFLLWIGLAAARNFLIF